MIKIYKENIWQNHLNNTIPIIWVVVPTNVGWKSNGCNIMGKGLALEAKNLFPSLPKLYGEWCKSNGDELYINEDYKIICAPSKSLNKELPWLSWKDNATLDQVHSSYEKLFKLALTWSVSSDDKGQSLIKCPLLGIGNGQLTKESIIDMLDEKWEGLINVRFVEKQW